DKNINSAIKKNNHLEEKNRKIYKEFQSKLEKQKQETLKRLDILNREAEKRKSTLSVCMKQFGYIHEVSRMDHNELNEWLKSNRFEDASKILKNFSGSELVKLKKDELIELIGIADSIRFRNLLETSESNEIKTIYITLLNGNGEIVKDSQKSCILKTSSVTSLIDTASKCIEFPKEIIEYAYTLNICGQKII
ncbi:hypothetical protein MXB_904, partial [Myxobolus squamalis]